MWADSNQLVKVPSATKKAPEVTDKVRAARGILAAPPYNLQSGPSLTVSVLYVYPD